MSVNSTGRGGVDLDELARREEERDFLLRSIADLDREHEVGDVGDDDYDELRRGYVARAAEAIRAVDSDESVLERRRAETPRRRGRTLIWAGAVVVFTVVAGVLLANALGFRGAGVGLTGTGSMPDDAANQCRGLSMSKPAEGVTCYAKVLKSSPDNVEALTYQGWAKVRAGDVAGGTANFDRVVQLEPTYPDVHVFRASVLKNAGDFAGAQAELDRLFTLNPSPIVTSTLTQMGLDRAVAVGLLAPDVASCWSKEEAALTTLAGTDPTAKSDQAKFAGGLADLAGAMKCFDGVLAQRPADVDALVMRSLGVGLLGVIDDSANASAEANATSALAAHPGDPSALILRATWRRNAGDTAGALADLDALGDRRISPLIASYVDVSQIRAAVEADRAAAAASTTTSPATSPATSTAPR